MALCDTYFYPVLLEICRVSERNCISNLHVDTNIWFGVDGNAGATRKKNSTCPRLVGKTRSNGTDSEHFSQFACDICTRRRYLQKRIGTGIRGMVSNI